ncbi:MAG: hypothetical protein WA709_10945 [Stellaceae bacterium]
MRYPLRAAGYDWQSKKRAEPLRSRHVTHAKPGIDEHEPYFGLDQKAMADDLGGPRTGL